MEHSRQVVSEERSEGGEKMIEIKTQEEPAKWIVDIDNTRSWDRVRFYCSACGDWNTYGKTKYCPECGARVEEE